MWKSIRNQTSDWQTCKINQSEASQFFFVENHYNSLSSAISSHMIRPHVGEFSLRVSSNKEKHSTKVQCLEFRSSDRMYSSLSTSKNHLTCTKSELVVNSVSTLLLFTQVFLIVYILEQKFCLIEMDLVYQQSNFRVGKQHQTKWKSNKAFLYFHQIILFSLLVSSLIICRARTFFSFQSKSGVL